MAGYQPLYIKAMEAGLIQSRINHILPNDAYPVLENAYVWRERIKRKQGYQLLGRLRRIFDDVSLGLSGASPWTFNIYTAINLSGTIVNATSANPVVITTSGNHLLQDGQLVFIDGVVGEVELNSRSFTINVTSPTTFELVGIDGSAYAAYISGGTWETNSITGQPQKEIEVGSVVITIDPIPITGTIIGYNNSTNCEVFCSAPHGLVQGDHVSISGVVVVSGSGDDAINGGPYTVSTPSPTSFTISRNSQTWGVYQSGGTWTKITSGAQQLIDQGDGTLATDPASATVGTINYLTGAVTITNGSAGDTTIIDFNYYPTLPVMGLRSRELNNINNEDTIAFDTVYAYTFNTGSGWQEFIPGTTWTGTDYQFFWSTNWFVNAENSKLFWVTNFSGTGGDPIRYTDGAAWFDFAPQITTPLGTNEQLHQCLCMLPFRSRLVTFNTFEGNSLANSVQRRQRIRWSAIGNPLLTDAWRSDIRGKGGFLDIPTAEDIVSVGYVRDNLVIYCEHSTWQLRYTGRSIAPFQIEKVNTELGAESTFSLVQFDTSLVGIGDKGIVECDSFKSNRIDIKIPDLIFQFNNNDNGPQRVHGIRDFYNRLAYWIYPYSPTNSTYPDHRLCYNYENDSWGIFTDSLTCLGQYQSQSGKSWDSTDDTWEEANYPWIDSPALFPDIVGGNQQGFVEILDKQTTNDAGLTIQGILGQTPQPTQLTSVNHNMQTGFVIRIVNIPIGTDFDSLNDQIFGIVRVDANTFNLYVYDPTTGQFSLPQINAAGSYVGGGQIQVRDNFTIQSKKFNFLDQGQTIQFGYVDIHLNTTQEGEISLNMYSDYADEQPVNTLPENSDADPFFNTVIPTINTEGLSNTKTWKRVYAQSRGAFITLEYTLSNAQMISAAQESEVEIDSQILWMRPAGTQIQQDF